MKHTRGLLWVVFATCLFGAALSVGIMLAQDVPATPAAAASPADEAPLTITLAKEEGPAFERRYVAALSGERTLVITMKTEHYRYRAPKRTGDYSQLVQANGNYIFFDPAHVAEKIIDPALVGPVEQLSARILTLDAAWLAESATTFTDSTGATWTKQP
jgi:hypothetical protein